MEWAGPGLSRVVSRFGINPMRDNLDSDSVKQSLRGSPSSNLWFGPSLGEVYSQPLFEVYSNPNKSN